MKILRDFVLREVAGDVLLVPTGKTALDLNGMMTLNEVGAEIWRMLPEARDSAQIAERLADDYDAPLGQIRADVDDFLAKLRELGIVE